MPTPYSERKYPADSHWGDVGIECVTTGPSVLDGNSRRSRTWYRVRSFTEKLSIGNSKFIGWELDKDAQYVREANIRVVGRDAIPRCGRLDPAIFDQVNTYMVREIQQNSEIDSSAMDVDVKNMSVYEYIVSRNLSFADLVRSGGLWDQKVYMRDWLFPQMPDSQRWIPVPATNEEIYYDPWASIHYAYVGRALRFTEATLMDAAEGHVLHLFPTSEAGKIDEGDRTSIEAGFDLFNSQPDPMKLTPSDLDTVIRTHLEDYRRASVPGSHGWVRPRVQRNM